MREESSGEIAGPVVVSILTHDNLDGLQRLFPVLREDARQAGHELLIIDNASVPETKGWLRGLPPGVGVIAVPSNDGPGAGRNAVLRARPASAAYVFFDDDVRLNGGELTSLLADLGSDSRVGLVSGPPCALDGAPLADSFTRRPLAGLFPRLWNRWWGSPAATAESRLLAVDMVGAASIAVRGPLLRYLAGFETRLWPAGFEDLDLCARVHFAGFRVTVDPSVPIRQAVSATSSKVLGLDYVWLRRSSGILFAAIDYPRVFAAGRLAAAIIGSMIAPSREERQGNAHGILRCAREWRYVLSARRSRRRLRQRAPGGLSLDP